MDKFTDIEGPAKANQAPGEKPIPGTALLRKLFVVLDIVGEGPGNVTVADLSERTGWPRATLYRILSAATAQGFLRLDPITRGYTLGFRFIELAQNVWSSGDLVTSAAGELRRLRDTTGETVHLAVLQDNFTLALGKFDSAHPHKDADRLGARKALHATSQGKAILAFLPEAESDALISRIVFKRNTANTLMEPQLLKAQLRIIRQRGFSVDDEEALQGTRCVGAPILDHTGRPIAAISISGPTYRVTSERVERLGPEVAQVAEDISQILLEANTTRRSAGDLPVAHAGNPLPALYGISPSWDEKRQMLHWADCYAPQLLSTARATRSYTFGIEQPISVVSHTDQEIVAFSNGWRLTASDGGRTTETHCDQLKQLCCIAVDGDGTPFGARFFEAENHTEIGVITPAGRIDVVWTLAARVTHMTWSRDGGTLYASVPERGLVYALLPKAPAPRILARISRASGEPHGLAVDLQNRLWVALYDGWSIVRLTEEGAIDQIVPLPVPRPTGIAFSTQSKKALYVTTARLDLAREVLENAPLSGRVLVAETGIEGHVPPPMRYLPGGG